MAELIQADFSKVGVKAKIVPTSGVNTANAPRNGPSIRP